MKETYRTFARITDDGEVQLDFCGSLNTEESQIEAVIMWMQDDGWLEWQCGSWFPVEVELDETL